jgi:DNA mismatch repair ATPase MutS
MAAKRSVTDPKQPEVEVARAASTNPPEAFEARFRRFKEETCHAILLYELGGNYTAFYSDADIVGNILGIFIAHPGDRVPQITLTGFRAEENIGRLTSCGWRVTIIGRIDSLTAPSAAQGIK